MFLDMVKHILLKHIRMRNLILLSFVYIVEFHDEAALANSNLAILERLQISN